MKIKSTEVLEKLKNIDKEDLAVEILTWLISNVPNFIDNHQFVYDLELSVPEREAMPVAYDLNCLYANREKDEDVLTEEEKDAANESAKKSLEAGESSFLSFSSDFLSQESKDSINNLTKVTESFIEFEESMLGLLNNHPLKPKFQDALMFFYEITGVKDDTVYLSKKKNVLEFLYFTYDDFDMSMSVTMKDPETREVLESTSYEVENGFGIGFELAVDQKDESLNVNLF